MSQLKPTTPPPTEPNSAHSNSLSGNSQFQTQSSKVLLMGRAGVGKTSLRSIVFANYLARETARLHPTNQVEHSSLRFLGSLMLSLWDCGGQDVFMENYFDSQREHIFRGVKALIYVVGSAEEEKERTYFSNSIESLSQFSPDASIYVLCHKQDLIPIETRQKQYDQTVDILKGIINKVCPSKLNTSIEPLLQETNNMYYSEETVSGVNFYPTSIWDETLYKAWSSILRSLVPSVDILENEIKKVANVLGADEVVLFETATFLVMAYHSRVTFQDCHRYEKISNIIKQFKLSTAKIDTGVESVTIKNNNFYLVIERFTENTFIMVVISDPLIYPAAINANICAVRSHFLDLAEGDPVGFGKYL